MTTALKAINGGSKQRSDRNHKQASQDKTIRPHCKISIEDINWVRQQPPCVQQLWLDSVAAEQFGGAAHKLETNLTYKSFQKAGAALMAQGLFQFEEVFGRLPSGRPGLIGYRVRNLHGYYNRFYWESSTSGETNSCNEKAVHAGKETNHAEPNQNHSEVEQIQPDLEQFQKNGQKSEVCCGFQNPNNVSNYPLTTYQQPTNVGVGMVVSSSTPAKILRQEETAIASSRDASPPTTQSASEEEESTQFASTNSQLRIASLMDAVPSCSASLLAGNQDLGDEAQITHEDTFSAAPAVPNFEKSSQPQNQAQSTQSASLKAENQILRDEPGTPHEVTCSAAPAVSETSHSVQSSQEPKAHHEGVCAVTADSNPQKWTREAVVERSRVRPWRMEKLKMAEQWRENPGDDFLMECWADDPALRIVIKKLVAKCPQWGLVAADGVLVKWEG